MIRRIKMSDVVFNVKCICTVIASGLPVMKAEDTECPIASLRIIYTPDTEYNEYTANWIISPDTAVPALG